MTRKETTRLALDFNSHIITRYVNNRKEDRTKALLQLHEDRQHLKRLFHTMRQFDRKHDQCEYASYLRHLDRMYDECIDTQDAAVDHQDKHMRKRPEDFAAATNEQAWKLVTDATKR